ncbi:hypothetical protein BGLA2_810029 [Burkholderia gladioli]|nr:hypothetical protein BGLA2_810029 [Burkholderia gladioli]
MSRTGETANRLESRLIPWPAIPAIRHRWRPDGGETFPGSRVRIFEHREARHRHGHCPQPPSP